MVSFPSNSGKKSLQQRLDFSDKKGLQLWSVFLQIQAKNHYSKG